MSEIQKQSFGQKSCGVTFNPGGNPDVDSIKRQFAAIVDDLNDRRTKANNEMNLDAMRMYSIAITEAQTAQMWAVKAVTWTK